MRRLGVFALVFFLSLIRLSYNVHRVGMASGEIDKVGHIAAQDESVYSHIALRMAADRDWMTPKFLGRYALFKPPLLYWLAAASVSAFGKHAWALRLPSLVAGAAVAALLFASVGGWQGLVAALLLLSNPLWHILSRLCLMDALLALGVIVAMLGVNRHSLSLFTIGTAVAILTKGIAGLIPMIGLLVWWLLSP